MRLDAGPANALLRFLLRIACRLDMKELDRLPRKGPAVFIMNHINFLEAPLFGSFLYPRPLAAMSKKENSSHPVISYFARLWNAIPVDRGAAAGEAFRACDRWLARGGILGLAPEGTRSGDGVLRPGKAGVALIAHRAGVPVWPIAHWGGESFWSNLKRLRRTRVNVRVGRPFFIEPEGGMTRSNRQEVADEIMARIAELMPARYRGAYSAACGQAGRHLRDAEPAEANSGLAE